MTSSFTAVDETTAEVSRPNRKTVAYDTVGEFAEKRRLNKKTVYDAIARKEIRVVRVGRSIRIPVEE
jgi:excisionase family DNA binding protein